MFEKIYPLVFAFILGIQHSFEPDHIFTISALILNNKSIKKSLLQGTLWAIGHTITIISLGIVIFLLKSSIPKTITTLSEFLVGIVLIILGLNVIKEFKIKKIHLHKHSHGRHTHIHLHSHANDKIKNPLTKVRGFLSLKMGLARPKGQGMKPILSNHLHSHSFSQEKKALFLGILHGIAGSAALILLISFNSIMYASIYLLIFGLGTLFGMNTMAYLISLPIIATRKRFLFINRIIKVSTSIFSMIIGMNIVTKIVF